MRPEPWGRVPRTGGGAGTGIQGRLKPCCPSGLVGSNPTRRTMKKLVALVVFVLAVAGVRAALFARNDRVAPISRPPS